MIADWIKCNRERKCWSQKHLAKLVGVDPQTVALWERGVSRPRTNNQIKLMQLFNSGIRAAD